MTPKIQAGATFGYFDKSKHSTYLLLQIMIVVSCRITHALQSPLQKKTLIETAEGADVEVAAVLRHKAAKDMPWRELHQLGEDKLSD
jgi:hypothetical protein